MILGRFSAATRRWSDSVCVALFCVCFFRQGLSKEGEACYVFFGMTDNSGLADTDRGWCFPGALQGLILSSYVGWVVPRAVLGVTHNLFWGVDRGMFGGFWSYVRAFLRVGRVGGLSPCVRLPWLCFLLFVFYRVTMGFGGQALWELYGMYIATFEGFVLSGSFALFLGALVASHCIAWGFGRQLLWGRCVFGFWSASVSRCGIGWRFSLRKGGWIAISLFQPNGTASTPMCRLEFSGVYMADSKASFSLWNKFRNAPAPLRDEGDSPILHFQPPATFCGKVCGKVLQVKLRLVMDYLAKFLDYCTVRDYPP
ncbi:hypothetical protein U1Q18_027641 [Sarracenia purpurea var. burkii]